MFGYFSKSHDEESGQHISIRTNHLQHSIKKPKKWRRFATDKEYTLELPPGKIPG